jgi:hypothetical protein
MTKFFNNPIAIAILIVIAFVAIVFFLTNKFSKKTYAGKSNIEVGLEGEAKVAELLDYVTYTNGYRVFNDVLLFGGTDKSVQIDHIVVGRSGIYLIETKNYKGRICAFEGNYWYQVPKSTANPVKFYSPEKQGLYHMYMLVDAIGLKDKKYCHLITAVPDDTSIENHTNAKVLHFKNLAGELVSNRGNFLSDETVEKICERIQKANTNTAENLKKHVLRVGSLYK